MQILHILPTVPRNYVKFATKFIHISSMLQVPDNWQRTPRNWSKSYRFHRQFLRTMRNSLNPHPWPVNTSEPSELLENTANHQNSAPFAPPPGKHRKFHVFHTHQTRKVTHFTHLLHIIYMYAHIFAHL